MQDGVVQTGVGWHCKVCDCYLKDSHTYLDHINGRKHQKKLGYSMRVERNTQEQVEDTLQQLVLAKQQATEQAKAQQTSHHSLEDLVKAKDELAQKRREERRARRRQKQQGDEAAIQLPPPPPPPQQLTTPDPVADDDNNDADAKEGNNEEEEEEDVEEEEIDPALAAMMGFSGFGTSKRNR
jgi:U4/U6.U5 tri-snRNP component SNU23